MPVRLFLYTYNIEGRLRVSTQNGKISNASFTLSRRRMTKENTESKDNVKYRFYNVSRNANNLPS